MSGDRRGSGRDTVVALTALTGFSLVWGPVLVDLVGAWSGGGYYTYGYLVPLFSAFLVWDERRTLAGPPAWRLEGLVVVAAGFGLLLVGGSIQSLSLRGLSLVIAVAGLALFALGPARFRRLSFATAFLVFMTPLPHGVIPAVSLPLQRLAAASTGTVLALIGVPVTRDGLLLELPTVTLQVTEACNGLRFLLAMTVLGVAFAWATRARLGERAVIVAAALLVAIGANVVRVIGTALLADLYGPEAAMGFFHLAYGKVVYLAALVPFVAFVIRLRRRGDVSSPLPSAAPDAGPLTVSVLVPTKNRPALLAEAVRSLLRQTARIDELVIADQSDTEDGRHAVEALLAAQPEERRPALIHVWDRTINGTAAARNVALERACGDVVVYCDDDVAAEPDVIERLLAHYRRRPGLGGVAPVITNYPAPSWIRRALYTVFCLGPFRDERQPVYWYWRRYAPGRLVRVRMFTGAMMSFRRSALAGVRCDGRFRGPSVGEDIDMCWALSLRGIPLAIATDARIVHNRAPREVRRGEAALITSWAFLYDKHVPKTFGNRAAFLWFLTGVLLVGAVASVQQRRLAPLRSALTGLRHVLNDYEGSSFLAPRSHAA